MIPRVCAAPLPLPPARDPAVGSRRARGRRGAEVEQHACGTEPQVRADQAHRLPTLKLCSYVETAQARLAAPR